MELALVRHELSAGWSQELPAIDSASTLVIVFVVIGIPLVYSLARRAKTSRSITETMRSSPGP